MKTLLSFLFALLILTGCGSREDDPIVNNPTTPEAQISAEFIGTWQVLRKKTISGYIENTDTTLFITVSAKNIKYKIQNGGSFDGFGTLEKASNADQVTLTNGSKVVFFKTLQPDGTQNFFFQHPGGLADDYMVKKN